MTRKSMIRDIRRQPGFFGIAAYNPKHEVNVGTLWRTAMIYQAGLIGTVGIRRYQAQASDTPRTPNHIPLQHYRDVDDLIEHLPYGCPLIGVELDDRAVPLTSFQHPRNAFYLLGAEDHGLPAKVLDRCHHVVQIPTPAAFSMNVAVAGSILMYDRAAKAERATRVEVAA